MDVYNSAQELNAYALGYALDDLSGFSFSQLFGTFAFGIALDHKLLGDRIILHSTSISVSGQYKRAPSVDGEPAVVHLIHGHSKDKRPARDDSGSQGMGEPGGRVPILDVRRQRDYQSHLIRRHFIF